MNMAWCDVHTNLDKAERYVAKCAADIVVLPEMFATGYVVDTQAVAQPADGTIVSWLRKTAAKYDRAIVGSVAIAENGKCFNRMYFAKRSGELVWADKRHLFAIGGENRYFTAGRERIVTEYRGMRFLLLVCYDLRLPVWSRNRGDYDAIIYSASWAASRRNVWRTLLRARAMENQAYVIGVNRTGADPSTKYAGDSAIVDFRGETLKEMNDSEGIADADLDLEQLVRFRNSFPTWRDADDYDLKM